MLGFPCRAVEPAALALLGLAIIGSPPAVASRALVPKAPATDDHWVRLVDVAPQAGITVATRNGRAEVKNYILEVNGNGAAWIDYDRDGDPDLVTAQGSTLQRLPEGGDPLAVLYRNRSGAFRVVTESAALHANGWGAGACAGDYDGDGWQDLYLTAYGENALYRNNGDGTFTETANELGVDDPRWGSNCTFGDYDRDGDLDLYVANYLVFDPAVVPPRGASEDCRFLGAKVFCGPAGLEPEHDVLFRNEGAAFRDVTVDAGLAGPPHTGFGVVFSDLDHDGWPDLHIANDAMPNQYFLNQRDGTFREEGLLAGLALSATGRAQSGMGLAVEDYDGDGLFDVFVTNFSLDTNTLYRNEGGGQFLPVTAESRAAADSFLNLGWGTALLDLDNDGWRDLVVANGHVYPEIADLDSRMSYRQPKEIYRNRAGTFEPTTADTGADVHTPWSSRGLAYADYDGDGDLDLAVTNIDQRPSLYRNDGGERGNWLRLVLVDRSGPRDAIGSRVEIDVAGRTLVGEVRSGGSYLSHHETTLHFGLGHAERVDEVRVRWPDGVQQAFGPFEARRVERLYRRS